MKITYTNTFSHLMSFNIYHSPRTRSQKISTLLLIGIIAILFWPRIQLREGAILPKLIVFLIIVFIVLAIVAILNFLLMLFANSPKKNKGFLTNHEITLSEEGLFEVTPFNKSKYSWSGIEKVVQTRSYIFIYVSEHAAHVIPKKSFETENKAEQFFEYAYKNWQEQNDKDKLSR